MKMSSPKILCAAIAFVIATGAQAGAVPTPIAPPAAGSAAAFPAAAPNPAQFVFGSGTVASSTAVNSNFNKLYSDMAQVVTALNGCAFATGSAIATVVATAPITANVSTCVAGQGTGETLTLGLTGSIGIANGGTGTATPGLVSGPNISITNPWPNQTIGLSGIIPIASGGTGSATPGGVIAGSNVTITGAFPNQTISAATTSSIAAYNLDGTARAGTHHTVGSLTINATNGALFQFTGAAAFTSAATFSCMVNNVNINGVSFYFNQSSGSATNAYTVGNVTTSGTIAVDCFGY